MNQKPSTVENPIAYARDVVGRDPLALYLGIEVEEVREAYARVSLVVKPQYLNAVERAHGGIIHALADQAFAVGCNSTGHQAIALNFQINYLAAASDGERIFAECTPQHVGRKVSVWTIEVRGANDTLVATGTGTAYHR